MESSGTCDDDYKQLAVNSTKQQIRNILKSYVGYYAPLCELLQNAMDAVDRRKEILNEKNYEKKIRILIFFLMQKIRRSCIYQH